MGDSFFNLPFVFVTLAFKLNSMHTLKWNFGSVFMVVPINISRSFALSVQLSVREWPLNGLKLIYSPGSHEFTDWPSLPRSRFLPWWVEWGLIADARSPPSGSGGTFMQKEWLGHVCVYPFSREGGINPFWGSQGFFFQTELKPVRRVSADANLKRFQHKVL